jgi:hypothetical protein
MKRNLVIAFVISQIVELGIFWLISGQNLNIFFALVGVDLILTAIFCREQLNNFVSILLNNEQN